MPTHWVFLRTCCRNGICGYLILPIAYADTPPHAKPRFSRGELAWFNLCDCRRRTLKAKWTGFDLVAHLGYAARHAGQGRGAGGGARRRRLIRRGSMAEAAAGNAKTIPRHVRTSGISHP